MPLIDDDTDEKIFELAQLESSIKNDELKARQKLAKLFTDSIEDLTGALQDFTDAINRTNKASELKTPELKTPEYFDKDLNKNLTGSIDKVFKLLENFKQPELDLSPIKSIATEIKNQNSSLITLVQNLSKESNKSGYESLVKEVMSMVQKSNDFISKGFKQVDNSGELKGISAAIQGRKPTAYELIVTERTTIGNYNYIKKAIFTPIQNTDISKT